MAGRHNRLAQQTATETGMNDWHDRPDTTDWHSDRRAQDRHDDAKTITYERFETLKSRIMRGSNMGNSGLRISWLYTKTTPHMNAVNQMAVCWFGWYFLITIGCGTGRSLAISKQKTSRGIRKQNVSEWTNGWVGVGNTTAAGWGVFGWYA